MPTLRSKRVKGRARTQRGPGPKPPAATRHADPGKQSSPRVSRATSGQRSQSRHLKATRGNKVSTRKAQCQPPRPREGTTVDGCLTDPEPGMDSRRATVRNMRSKCRCSCVLQFTFRRAVSCVLHRPPSQVIHCTVLFFLELSLREESSTQS